MNKYYNKYSKRINRINIIIVFLSIFILSNFFLIQFKKNNYLDEIIDKHGYKHRKIHGKRGRIIDSNERELAYTVTKYTLWVNTNTDTNNSKEISDILSRIYKKNRPYYSDKLKVKKNYVVLEKDISENKFSKIIDDLKNLKRYGLRISSKDSRLYKYNNFASQTIGYIDGNGIGVTGIEKKFNNLLAGDTLKITLKKGAQGSYFNQDFIQNTPINGADIQLTIDIEIQKIVQEEIQKIVKKSNAKSGNGILINPSNGNIIAMASIPDFDPNNYHTYNIENFRNRVISDAYEPGSTFKIIPLALSLEKNTFSLSDSIHCEEGEFLLSSNKKLHDHEPHSLLSLEDIMAYSSNIGFAKLSDYFNNDDFYKFLKYFGFGTKSFISLNNESQGIIRNAADWSKTSKNYISIGQELSTTNLQLALAYSVIANGGFLVRPNIIKNVMHTTISTENVFNKRNYSIRKVISKKTADLVMQTLDKVIEIGTGKELNLNNYKIAGKTGTAQKYIDGEYSNYIATFVSLFPKDKPKYILVVSIDEPEYGYHWSSQSAVPASKEIIKRMVIADNNLHYHVASNTNLIKEQLHIANHTPKIQDNEASNFPDLKGKSFKEARKIAFKYNVMLIPENNILSGQIIYQSIKAGVEVKPGMVCDIKMGII